MSGATQYEAVIGLEIHVQLRTKSKMFCRCDNRADGAKPNELTCPVCLGLPGALPVPNRTAVEWALKVALALGCTIPDESKFDRKQYFYPDLPKGYQISQYDQPFGGPGTFEFDMVEDGKPGGKPVTKKIGITRLHLEEDAGKLTHPKGADYSLVDLNRSGTPLAEIVTEPDLRSPAEAKRFLQELRRLMRYLGVSDADMEKGHLRADANVSLRKPGEKKLGTKTELKNLNSFRFVEKGLASEIKRQTELLGKGEKIDQETRGFDEDRGKTVSQRGKEEAHDYRYFPEPDIPPLNPKELNLEKLEAETGMTPMSYRRLLYKDDNRYIASQELLDAAINSKEEMEAIVSATESYIGKPLDGLVKNADNQIRKIPILWLSYRQYPEFENRRNLERLKEFTLSIAPHVRVIRGPQAKVISKEWEKSNGSLGKIIDKFKSSMASGGDIEAAVDQAIKDNPKPAADFKAGNVNAKQVIVGAVMKATKGAADASEVAQLVEKKLS
ncbi:MAG: Asp-tRNA(Asn)/Glu-tRNA(Gln) amidotransferase subunit GatB [bacterium]|nr:Asp-tRNA(Asn)/Glu-tRNA(Gln) amidotransferase subunit GatB [bacterium]MDZ4247923.1 Asp-tRNA(Asn)/Glu-tRNA(Gln) amidotransferase subunit GatB [Patescibacteria group bacterium]